MKMAKALLAFSALTAAAIAPTTVSAATLLDLVNFPAQTNTPYAFTITAATSALSISFAGYQVPSSFEVSSIGLFLNDTGTSIISGNGSAFTFAPAPSGSLAAPTANGFLFAGVTVGSYDTFSQLATVVAGASYTLRFNLSNSSRNQPSGFRVDTNDVTIAAVPEPATWAMMLVGFGMIGATVRYRRRSVQATYA